MELSARIPPTIGGQSILGRICTDTALPEFLRKDEILLAGEVEFDRQGWLGVLALPGSEVNGATTTLPQALGYLGEGDIIKINQHSGEIRVLYRKASRHNVLFFTERCNSRCLMCSQPPREIDDHWLVAEILTAIPLMALETPSLCITGGEPTLVGNRLFEVIAATKMFLPETALHMLSNGRAFERLELAVAVADAQHHDFMIGIPLYADVARIHDFVVQAKGAFDQTIRGILNLARCEVPTELRFVIHKQTVPRMAATARFIARNLPFVRQVALMGLEMTGYTRSNLDALWIDPFDYQSELAEAVAVLHASGINVLVYNLPLCVIPKDVRPFARQSISDWKNIYLPECEACAARHDCCGFFASSSLRRTAHVEPITPESYGLE